VRKFPAASEILPAGLEGTGAMFDAIARRYDLLNRLMSLGKDHFWRNETAKRLGSPRHVLDLATGTGDLALEVARLNPGATIVGLDPSEGMLEIGRRKAARMGFGGRIEYVKGDAQRLPFDNSSFDAVSMAFGIRNVPDRPRALLEIARVASPGAPVALLELTEPRGRGLGAVARLHVHWVVPLLGALLSGSQEYAYLSRSIAAFPPPSEFVQLAQRSGLVAADVVSFSLGACHLFLFTRDDEVPP
jgi:demethylmenaquinone methyltransferase / 2-methoxy-6-polyprenyl-1,4-benzoquinol methylase